MKNTKRILLYLITVTVIVLSFVWNYYMNIWIENQAEPELVVRTDLFVIYPLVLTLVALSIYYLFFKKQNQEV